MKPSTLLKNYINHGNVFIVPCKFMVIRGIQNLHDIGRKINLDSDVLHESYWIYPVMKLR